MDNVTRYAAVNSKVKVLEGRMLKDDDYMNLLNKKSVPEIAAYLKSKTHYKEAMDRLNENEMHRSRLENFIKEVQINYIDKIIHFFDDGYRGFFLTTVMRYEIEDLKSVLRAIRMGDAGSIDKDSLVHINKYSGINSDALIGSKNFSDFVRCLKGTAYYTYLYSFIENRDDFNLFRIEMTLDLAYFDLFYKNLHLLDEQDRKIMKQIQDTNVDLLNIQWIYRGLKFYNLSPEELFNYTIAYGDVFTRKDIKDFCYMSSLDGFLKRILATKYFFLFDNEDTRDIFMERRILRYQYYNITMKLKRSVSMDISQVMGFAQLLDNEIRDIISIMESVRYGMATDEAKKFLIRKL